VRVAVLSDVHGNLTALEAVLADVREAAPDLALHGGDLADAGASPVEVIDRLRGLGWPGVRGNTDEMLFEPASLAAFASGKPALAGLFAAVGEMAAFTRDALGPERLDWLRALPLRWTNDALALVHASPDTPWRAPGPDAPDDELASVYGPLARALVVYGHVHRPFVRDLGAMTVANSGSVGMPHDGDPRASYLLVDDGRPQVRRVTYDVGREQAALARSALPHAGWTARILESARPEMP
jgi:putative phosphoesterase